MRKPFDLPRSQRDLRVAATIVLFFRVRRKTITLRCGQYLGSQHQKVKIVRAFILFLPIRLDYLRMSMQIPSIYPCEVQVEVLRSETRPYGSESFMWKRLKHKD